MPPAALKTMKRGPLSAGLDFAFTDSPSHLSASAAQALNLVSMDMTIGLTLAGLSVMVFAFGMAIVQSALDGFLLNHSDFLATFEDLTSIPQGPTGLEAWPDVLVRLTRAPRTLLLATERELTHAVE